MAQPHAVHSTQIVQIASPAYLTYAPPSPHAIPSQPPLGKVCSTCYLVIVVVNVASYGHLSSVPVPL